MKKHFLSFSAWMIVLATLLAFSCKKSGSTQETTATPETATAIPALNTLSADEKAAGWELLFDGNTLDGWKRYNHDTIGPLWIVKDGAIVCNGEGLTEGTKGIGGSLTTIRQFGNFDLTAEWKISPGGNSGIVYHSQEGKKYKNDYETGPEMQVMDDAGWKGKMNDNQKAGSNYGMFAAGPNKKLNPVGEWNTIRITYNNGHVEHWLNGEKVVEFEEGSPAYEEAYKKSKWTKYPDWNKTRTGAIGLQDHGANVYYRNIKVKAL